MASFIASARIMDECCGTVLRALEENDLAEETLVIATTDHGIAFPFMKCNLTDGGLGVYLIIRGPGGFNKGRCIDGMVSHVDIYPTLCELLDIDPPRRLEGKSLLPLVRRKRDEIHEALFGESTYHAAYEPQRSIRTQRWKYIRRFDPDWTQPVMPNCDAGPSKRYLVEHGWPDRTVPTEQLYDLVYDPNEAHNLAQSADHQDVRGELADRLRAWMERTNDPLLEGPVPLIEGGVMNPVDGEQPDAETAGRKKFSKPDIAK
jgi:arylsulfatase A-like enzyme